MTRFTVRVELHRANDRDYAVLHLAMEQRGFMRTITADDGRTYHLPTAEYDYEGESRRHHVLDLAREAARTTGTRFPILVTQSDGRTWTGLSEV